jgi:hypothetical protein
MLFVIFFEMDSYKSVLISVIWFLFLIPRTVLTALGVTAYIMLNEGSSHINREEWIRK